MGLRDDLRRFREVGDERRLDLREFVEQGELGDGDRIRIPIKLVELPEFRYDPASMGGVGRAPDGSPEPGDQVSRPQDGDGDGDGDGDEAGEGQGEHAVRELDYEEFAAELDEELGLDLEPKGTTVVAEVEGDYAEVARTGPTSTLDLEHLFTSGLRRALATGVDEAFLRELLRVEGWGPDEAFRWAREQHMPVSRAWFVEAAATIEPGERDRWPSLEALTAEREPTPAHELVRRRGLSAVTLRREDERYRHAETTERRERSAVVVNVRDVSGSMRADKRELVHRVFTPMDWYLRGKYDHAEFHYVVHDSTAWTVDRDEFFGLESGGGTRISSGYRLAAELLEDYPESEWNRYVFAAGDGENSHRDTEDAVVPLMEGLAARRQAYVETRPGGGSGRGTHGDQVAEAFADREDVVVTTVTGEDDVMEAIGAVLRSRVDTDRARETDREVTPDA